MGGCILYGYEYSKVTREFSINEAEAEIVERIFTQYLQGATPYRIASELNDEGVATIRGVRWKVNQVLTILNNSFYTGVLKWQGIINKESHEGIITERIFRKVQKKLSVKKCWINFSKIELGTQFCSPVSAKTLLKRGIIEEVK